MAATTAFALTAPAIATLSFQDAKGNTVKPPTGSTISWVSSDTTFATVTPAADGMSAEVDPVDTTGATPGSSVITATVTNPDGTQAIATGAVANTDDVTVANMAFAAK